VPTFEESIQVPSGWLCLNLGFGLGVDGLKVMESESWFAPDQVVDRIAADPRWDSWRKELGLSKVWVMLMQSHRSEGSLGASMPPLQVKRHKRRLLVDVVRAPIALDPGQTWEQCWERVIPDILEDIKTYCENNAVPLVPVARPRKIRISRVPGYVTDTIGTYGSGQFFASVTGSGPETESYGEASPTDWQKDKRWYAVLHLFDKNGRHVDSRIECLGTTADGESRVIPDAETRMSSWLGDLADVTYTDITVRPFKVTHEDRTFGLVASEDGGEPSYEFLPGGISFYPPWDGSYDT